jgi:hypothetical protein
MRWLLCCPAQVFHRMDSLMRSTEGFKELENLRRLTGSGERLGSRAQHLGGPAGQGRHHIISKCMAGHSLRLKRQDVQQGPCTAAGAAAGAVRAGRGW